MPKTYVEQKSVAYRNQQALRLASQGKHAAWLHLLFPLTVLFSCSALYVIPSLIGLWFDPSRLTSIIQVYLTWDLPLLIVVNLLTFHWARKRVLAPYLDELLSKQSSEIS